MPRPKTERPIKKIAVTLYEDQIEEVKLLSASGNRPFSTQLRMVVDEGLRVMRSGMDRYLERGE